MKHTKRLAAVLLMLAMVLPAFGASKPMELTLLYGVDTPPVKGVSLDGYTCIEAKLIAQFQRETGVLVNRKLIDLSTGSTMSMDALVAAGIAPDVYSDFAGRVSKYMVPEFALDFKGYFKDLEDFQPSIMAGVTRNGKILAIPTSSWATGFCTNEDLLDEVGYKIPAEWTIDEFLKVAELLKAKGKYVTVLFSKDQSSDQGWMPYFYAFGARVYNPGDYTKTVLNQPKSLGTLKFFQTLVEKGYVPPNPPTLDDGTALDLFGRGKVAFLSAQVGHLPVIESAVKQGLIPKAFKIKFNEFPHAAGEKPTPTASGPTLNLVHKTKDEARNKAAARLAWYISNTEFQTYLCKSQGSFPSRKSVGNPMADNPYWVQIANIINKNGVCDFGITTQTFTAVRAQMFPLLSEMYMGKMTPEEVLKTYEKNVNDILAGK